jgi:hypothetical protein
MQQPAADLQTRADILLPPDTDLFAWCETSPVKLVHSGARVRVLAPAEGALYLVPLPKAPLDTDSYRTWLRTDGRRMPMCVGVDAETRRITQLPDALLADPTVAPHAGALRAVSAAGPSQEAAPDPQAGGGDVVEARDLARHVRTTRAAPPLLRGSRGHLYGEIARMDRPPSSARGTPPAGSPEHVLCFHTRVGEGKRLVFHVYAPAGGSYMVVLGDEQADPTSAQSTFTRLDAHGRPSPVSTTERMRLWSEVSRTLSIVAAIPGQPLDLGADPVEEPELRVQDAEETASQDAAVPFDTAGLTGEEEDQPQETPQEVWDLMATEAAREETFPTAPEEEQPGRGGADARNHGVADGLINIDNWTDCGEEGEAWVAALLRAVADADELRRSGLLPSVNLVSAGLPATRADLRILEVGVRDISGRATSARVFHLQSGGRSHSCIAYRDGDDVRLVGVGGPPGRELREAVASHFCVSERRCKELRSALPPGRATSKAPRYGSFPRARSRLRRL